MFNFLKNKDTVKKIVPINKEIVDAQKNNSKTNDFSKMMSIGFIHEEVKMFHRY